MDSKRRISKIDDRLIRENEYIGRVLNEKVKEIDKLKVKFERKLQQEKEKFAVQHLSVTSSFNEKKGARKKKISLAFDESERRIGGYARTRQLVSKSISDSELASREIMDNDDKLNCLFPPLINNTTTEMNRKYSRAFSEGVRIQKDVSSGKTAQNQRNSGDSVRSGECENPKKGRRISKFNQGVTPQNELSKIFSGSKTAEKSELLTPSNITVSEESLPDWQREIIEAKRQEKEGSKSINEWFDTNDNIVSSTENKIRLPRSSRQSLVTQNIGDKSLQQDELGPIEEKVALENISRVNMVKNLTKQQRFDMEHRVTFLPPMHRIFKDDIGSDPRESDKDIKRLSMAKKRWLKAYNLAKENFQGSGPKESTNPIHVTNLKESQTETKCSEDPRLLRLVSLLSKRRSICRGKDVETGAALEPFSMNPI
eukprot:gene294-9946_t